ncbi:hypothetical protein KDA_73080 [Dictyobacter alpinus]|uniref:Response regulatory domain-containing protein n=1 Tax=Dictyobacter alpinus TaxID=2014873 RepID=A0A402BKE6_9CHLR|nr:response regulator [Dictyobacter alpinus]GCE31824.1 hypothetical protein KDA_73080 [Dictyobacter alpinus]
MDSPKTILVVEDDEMTACMLSELLLQERGYSTLATSSARATLDRIDTVKPDLLIIDYHLPYMNGLELHQVLRQQEKWQQTPVIFLSALLTQQEMLLHNVVGLEKPFEVEDLLLLIDRFLHQQYAHT